MTLVIDATVALAACGIENGFDELEDPELLAPPLMWSEAYSVLHELRWRGEVGFDDAERTRARLDRAAVAVRNPHRLRSEAWRIADELGWAKTYDAEYLALALLSGCRVVTLDRRFRRGAVRLGLVVTPDEL